MILSKIDFYLDWPTSIGIKDLRKYIIMNLMKKGEVIRWSIIDVQNSIESCETKKLRIHAVLAN